MAAIDGQVHRRAEDRVAKINRQFGIEVGTSARHFFEADSAATEEIGKNVGESAGACTATAAAATGAAGELREIETGERILASTTAAERERLGTEPVVLLALLLVAEHRIRFRDLLELVLRFLVPLVLVRVILLRQASIGLLDFLFAGALLHTEDLVVILLRHGRGTV